MIEATWHASGSTLSIEYDASSIRFSVLTAQYLIEGRADTLCLTVTDENLECNHKGVLYSAI